MPSRMHRYTAVKLNRRSLLVGTVLAGLVVPTRSATAQSATPTTFGLLVRADGPGAGLSLHDPATGAQLLSFATDGRPESVWPSTLPGTAFVRTDRALALVDCVNGRTLPIALPQDVVLQILPKSIQFRGSRGRTKTVIGTPASSSDTYLVDLETGERTSVIGMIVADPPPVTLQNVALSSDDQTLIVWDGRRTWVINLATKVVRELGTGQFTFSAGFMADGTRIAYSQQLANGTTELRLQNPDGTADELLSSSEEILVSLPVPGRDALLLDERDVAGGTLGIHDLTGLRLRGDLLDYTGATNIVQFTPDGEFALVGIEGEAGRDWYRLTLKSPGGSALLIGELADAEVQPGFDFDSDWAVATLGADNLGTGSVIAVDLAHGETTPIVQGITTDAQVGKVEVAPGGPGALLSIDSFTEFTVKFIDLELGEDRSIDLMKGGSGVLAPTGDAFAVAFDLNTGGTATVVYDAAGQEQVTIQGKALGWI